MTGFRDYQPRKSTIAELAIRLFARPSFREKLRQVVGKCAAKGRRSICLGAPFSNFHEGRIRDQF
jgi:hypothetical protein